MTESRQAPVVRGYNGIRRQQFNLKSAVEASHREHRSSSDFVLRTHAWTRLPIVGHAGLEACATFRRNFAVEASAPGSCERERVALLVAASVSEWLPLLVAASASKPIPPQLRNLGSSKILAPPKEKTPFESSGVFVGNLSSGHLPGQIRSTSSTRAP
jgi:hypothetical protein